LLGTVALANIFWFVSFSVDWGSFWIKISLSAAILAFLSRFLTNENSILGPWNRKAFVWGIGSAGILYDVFWAGGAVFTGLVPFADEQMAGIYQKGAHTPFWLMMVLALFVTGPSEEYFWRGFVQRQLMDRFGDWQGWLLGAVVYGSVHVWSFNWMLIGAAVMVGAFWGWLYWHSRTLLPVILSHSIWSALAFAIFPFG